MASSTTMNPPGISVHITVHIRAEEIPAFLHAFRSTFDAVANEPECTLFQVYQSPQNPGEISWVEHWSASLEYLTGVILNRDYILRFLELTEPMYARPREARVLTRVAGLGMVKRGEGSG
ncbi:putative quinol monooxygenase [Aspergillus mulundensis]|uniref:ABM domain-containing protein n=1 Tax=Aspergillus mulundensis TaxID=1810919 RepID=A0A3D8SAY5_9EURO|nr:Uncharacterized protein DSM5745_03865 [Aspergillus mulundensis]RDW83539.1 Uncharacterized protein DSM5745_03865 [Aspergillus mulundensis]